MKGDCLFNNIKWKTKLLQSKKKTFKIIISYATSWFFPSISFFVDYIVHWVCFMILFSFFIHFEIVWKCEYPNDVSVILVESFWFVCLICEFLWTNCVCICNFDSWSKVKQKIVKFSNWNLFSKASDFRCMLSSSGYKPGKCV